MTFICVAPHAWGRAEKIGVAIKLARRNYPRFAKGPMEYNVYEVEDPDAYVDQGGRIISRAPPKIIREVRYVGDQRKVKDKFDDPVLPKLQEH